jgi:hypothetical protein
MRIILRLHRHPTCWQKKYNEEANEYKPFGDTTNRYKRISAKEICEKVINQKDSSEGKLNCINLLNEIKSKELNFSIEKVNIPGQAFRASVSYRNIEKLYLRLIKLDDKLKEKLGNLL